MIEMDEMVGEIIKILGQLKQSGKVWIYARNFRKILHIDSYDRKGVRKINQTLSYLEREVGALERVEDSNPPCYIILESFEAQTKYISPLCKKTSKYKGIDSKFT